MKGFNRNIYIVIRYTEYMANEHVLIFETHKPIPFTVADGTGIEKGELLTMSDPMTAAKTSALGSAAAGVAAAEKIASDGKTKLGVYRGGIFKGTASGSVTAGNPLVSCTGGTNELEAAGTGTASENVFGIALETATDTQTFLWELRPMAQNHA